MPVQQLGTLEELVVLAVCVLRDQAYGVSVLQEIRDQTGRSLTLGAVHATLYRLQEKGLLESQLGGATEKRGGRRKRLFVATSTGFESIRTARGVREQMWSLIPELRTVGLRTDVI